MILKNINNFRYYDQLCIVENKLPILAQMPVAFRWNDAFDKGNRFRFPASLSKFII